MATLDTKLIVVFGATGAQGVSVVRALMSDSQYRVRGITRNPESERAQQLHKLGIEVVKADFSDQESIRNAIKGAYGVFLMTDFNWLDIDGDREVKEAIFAVDAAKEAGVQHLVFSGHESGSKIVGESVPHFDGKSRVSDYIKTLDIGYTLVNYALYYENHILRIFTTPMKNSEGIYEIGYLMGDCPFNMICVSEAGECVHQIFNRPDEFKGQEIGFSSDSKTVAEYAEDLNDIYKDEGRKFKASTRTVEELKGKGDQFSIGMANTFLCYKSGIFKSDLEKTRELNPNIPTYKQWVLKNKDAFTAALDSRDALNAPTSLPSL